MLTKTEEADIKHDNTPLHLLHRAGQCADELFAKNIGDGDVTPRQYEVLKAIDQSDEPSQTQLVAKTGIDRSTLADIVRRLVQRGLVQRQRTRRDARTYAVRLSDQGVVALNNTKPSVDATNTAILAAVPDADREVFLNSLNRIVETLEARTETKPKSKG
ncbi:MAG: MarR family winged helix-turn-helix transcriptional regulator [Hyphomicrobiaceae bacterium]